MSLYGLQKLIRDVNRNPAVRARFQADSAPLCAEYGLTDDETRTLGERDYGGLYRMGVHGLLLRPFSILHQVPESDYLHAIRESVG